MVRDEDLRQPLEEFGSRVRQARLALRVSQEDLADLCGLHRTYVGSIERGERNLSLGNILKLARSLKEDPGVLVGGLQLKHSRHRA